LQADQLLRERSHPIDVASAKPTVHPHVAALGPTQVRKRLSSGTQGVYQLQQALSDILGIPTSTIRVIYVEGAGCYGQNGSDDAAADAAF
jgi:hypothetical protein